MNRVTLIAGIGGGLVALALLAPATGTALGKLERARGAVAAARAAANAPARAPVPLTAVGLRAPGGNEAAAARALAERLRKLAAEGGEAQQRRLAAWRASALPGGSLRIEGEAVAAWR